MGIKRISIVKRKEYPQVSRIEENFEIRDKGEICIAIGGDGTFLEAARKFDVPILHIRGGEKESLGFHADVALKEVDVIIRELQSGLYSIKEYPKLRITHKSGVTDAVNDAVLFRGNPKSVHCMICHFDEDGKKALIYPSDIKGDGVIFSRQIGSTAYNFSAHGPIIYGVDVIAITPISANFKFSIISNKDFSVKVTKNIGLLQCDGVEIDRLLKGDEFTVNRSKKVIKVIKLKKMEGFSEKLARLLKF
jgi:NAD+ kinase